MGFERLVLLEDLRLGLPLVADVRIQGHKAMLGHRQAAHQQDGPVRPCALDLVFGEGPGGCHAGVDMGLRIAAAVIAAQGIEADEAFEWRSDISHLRREVEQAQKSRIPGHQAEIAVDQGEALVDQIQRRLQRFITLEA